MIITHHGGQCFKVQFGDTTLAFDPVSRGSKNLEPVKFGADIVFVSVKDADFNGVEQVTYGEREPFVIDGPGEYEVKKVTALGFATKSTYGGKERNNTVYFVELEGMNLCFLGALGMPNLPQEAREAFDDVDILFVPIGGEGVLTPSEANALAVKLEPHLIIPMHFNGMGSKDSLKLFLKEAGVDTKPIDKLTVKKKDLEGKEGEIVVL